MANEENAKIVSSLDLESEIPFTAIVDINQTKILIENTSFSVKSHSNEIYNEEAKTKIEQNIDIKSVCRICLKQDNNMVSLMSKTGHDTVADIFSSLTSIKINVQENFPLQICITCHEEIIHFYEFKVKCCNTNNYLTSIIKTESSVDQYPKFQNKVDRETQTVHDDIKIESYAENVSVHNIINKLDNNEYWLESKPKQEIDENEDHEGYNIFQLDNNKYWLESKPKQEIDENEDHEEIEYLEEELFLSDSAENIDEEHLRKSMSKESKDVKLLLWKKETQKDSKVKKRQLSCDMCSKKFIKTKSLKAHLKKCRSNNSKVIKPYGCPQCKESFICESDLQIHSALHTKGSNWTCNRCLKEFTERNRFRRHIQRHMESKRYACERCDKTFAELCALKRHARVHTGEAPEKRFHCDICDKRFSDGSQLRAHAARHSGARPCACHCGKAFPSRRLLASHRRVHSDLKQYACDYCDKRFRHESTRNTHHRTHTGEKPYVCSVCGKTFIQNSNLKLHIRTHTGEKPYSCDICGRKFTSGSSLTSHRRTHTGEKPYSCPVCGKRFARTDIRTHLRQHSGERPFACCACPKAFANAARLREHRLVHTGEKAYECAICSEKYQRKSYLAKHLKLHERDSKMKNNSLVMVHQLPLVIEDSIIFTENDSNDINGRMELSLSHENMSKDILMTEEIPLEVSGELILQDDSNMNTELVVVDNGENNLNFQGDEDENYSNNEINDVNLVTVNEGLNISASSVLDGTTVKLYQLDQSLVQIHTSDGHVTISKITSKMTANF